MESNYFRRLNEQEQRAYSLLNMVKELHSRGYQGVRIFTQVAISYRIFIFPIAFFSTEFNAYENFYNHKSIKKDLVKVWSGGGSRFIGTDKYTPRAEQLVNFQHHTATFLADSFINLYPEIIKMSKFNDYEYAYWYMNLMEEINKGRFPVFLETNSHGDTILTNLESKKIYVEKSRFEEYSSLGESLYKYPPKFIDPSLKDFRKNKN